MAITKTSKNSITTYSKYDTTAAGNASTLTSMFVINAAGSMFSSPDGITWTSRGTTSVQFIMKRAGLLIVTTGTSAGTGYSSPDGITWTSLASQAAGLSAGPKGLGSSPNGLYSEDGQLLLPQLGSSGYQGIAGDVYLTGQTSPVKPINVIGRYGNHITVSNQNNSPYLSYSTNGGATWANSSFAAGGINQHWVGPNGVVVITQSNLLYTSTDYGANFTQRATLTSGGSVLLKRINGLWIASEGSGNKIWTSLDAITWTPITHGLGVTFWDGTYANGLWVLVGDSGKILTSPDGTTWTSRTSGTASTIGCIVYV